MGLFLNIILALTVFGHIDAYEKKSVYQCLVDFGYTSVAGLIRDAKLESTLSNLDGGPFTVMAPTNAAVASIDADIMAAVQKNTILLQEVVKYHIINKFEVAPALIRDSPIQTFEGQYITVANLGGKLVINNASTLLQGNGDIICENGIIHAVDSVLIPPVFSTDNLVAVLLERDDIFKDIFMYSLLSNFTKLLEHGEYTLFAPTDLAFGRYSHLNDIHRDTPDAANIYLEILKYHIVPGARMVNMLKDGQTLYTLHGSPVTIHLTSGGVMVDDAHVVEANIPGSNGVIHAIDHVLYPADLLGKLQQG